MLIKLYILKFINFVLNFFRFKLVKIKRDNTKKRNEMASSYNSSYLPEIALDYLDINNPRLLEYKARYDSFDTQVTKPVRWKSDFVGLDDIKYFRGDNHYVWQLRGPNMNPSSYALTAYYINSIDKLGLLQKLVEDDSFGVYTFNVNNVCVSRDLLDSINEIYFLEENIQITKKNNFSVLDIGAGYGRLAHRMVNALPNISEYICTDAYPASTFISEFYIQFREIEDKAKVVPLDEIQDLLYKSDVDIALNIHSFTECTIDAIHWWISLIKKSKVKYFMIVPNAGNHGGEKLLTGDGKDFSNVFDEYGYKLIVKEPKYKDPIVQKYGINPTYYYLYQLYD